MIPTGKQIREARALIGMSQVNLAEAAGVKVELVTRAEQTDGLPMIKKVDSAAIQRALGIAGVEFLENGTDPSVRLRKSVLS